MHIITGTVIDGKGVLDGASLPQGAPVIVFARETDVPVPLPRHLQFELEQALADADGEEGISAEALLEQLKQYR